MKEKFKSLIKDDMVYVAVLLIGVGTGAFLLGQLSQLNRLQLSNKVVNNLALCPTAIDKIAFSSATPILTNHTRAGNDQSDSESTIQKPYVASKNGSRYHHITCPGAKQIKTTNQIFFTTETEAMSAGYTKAVNCNK